MRGIWPTRATGRTRWATRNRTPGGYTTCTETWRSGARIGMAAGITLIRRATTRPDHPWVPLAWTGAAAGTARKGTAARPSAATTRPGSGSTSWACDSANHRPSTWYSGSTTAGVPVASELEGTSVGIISHQASRCCTGWRSNRCHSGCWVSWRTPTVGSAPSLHHNNKIPKEAGRR